MIQVIGGGISGLVLAYYLRKKGHEVAIIENRAVGGILQSTITPFGLVESAANAMIANQLVEEVAKDIGIVLQETRKTARKRFIFRNHRLRRWPISFTASARFALVLLKAIFTRKFLRPLPNESILQWGLRIFGYETTTYLIAPAMSGIYSGDIRHLSAQLILGKWFRKRPNKGALRGSVCPEGGMGQWGEKLKWWLQKNNVPFYSQAIPDAKTILALPPPAAARYLQDKNPDLAALLSKIPMNSLASITLFFPSTAIEGFGCLFPREAGHRVLGVLSNTYVFPERSYNCFSETWIYGGETDPQVVKLKQEQILQLVLKERQEIFGKSEDPLHYQLNIWPDAIPNYNMELWHLQPELQKHKHELFGTYLGEIGLASLFPRAQQLAEEL